MTEPPDTYSPVPEGGSRRALRGGFGADAAAFGRTRPVCPGVLFDDPALADLARARTAAFPAVTVVTSSFEDWEDAGAGPLRAVAAFNALHWVDPGARYAKPAALLGPGGALAVGGCRWARPDAAVPFWAGVQEDYRAAGYAGSPPPPAEQIGGWHFPAAARGYFTETASLRYPFQHSCTAADYLAMLATQSGTRALGPDRAAGFLARVRRRLGALGWPQLTVTLVGQLTIGVRRPPG